MNEKNTQEAAEPSGASVLTDASVAERLKAKGSRKLTLPTLQEIITVRPLTLIDFIEMGILPAGFLTQKLGDGETLSEKVEERIMARMDEDTTFAAELLTMIVMRGVIDPPVVDCDPSAVPEGSVHVTTFGPDLLWLVAQLQGGSGLLQEVGPRALRFPDGGGSDPARPDGEEVRDDPAGAADDDPV